MIEDPGWENPYKANGASRIKPGRYNPLGTRWIGFKADPRGEFGIHGTNRPNSVGHFVSHGCVRMKIQDAEALFDQVRMGTPVEVTYDTVLLRPKGNEFRVVVYKDRLKKGMPSPQAITEQIHQEFPEAVIEPKALIQALNNPNERFQVVGHFRAEEPKPDAEPNEIRVLEPSDVSLPAIQSP
jgi:hypothetical protein